MPKELNPAALVPLYRAAIDVITEWEATPQDHGLDEALYSLRAAIALAESPAEQPPSGAMTLEQAREKASRLCRPARMGLCFEDVTEEFIRIDHAARRETEEIRERPKPPKELDAAINAVFGKTLKGLLEERPKPRRAEGRKR
jgi:hypothetical protein